MCRLGYVNMLNLNCQINWLCHRYKIHLLDINELNMFINTYNWITRCCHGMMIYIDILEKLIVAIRRYK